MMKTLLTDEQTAKLERYRDGILEINRTMNLTRVEDPQEFWDKHVLDSLACVGMEEYAEAHRVLDLGTGAGFPGIPLSVFSPDKEFLLVDSVGKKLKAVEDEARKIGLTNVSFVHGRAEDLARETEYREAFDLCVSRAVAGLPVLLEYCLPFIKVGGHVLSYKGPGYQEEVDASANALKKLGGEIVSVQRAGLEEKDMDHYIIVVRKTTRTPKQYPRKAGTPSKNPL
ncbi:MAG: 16S rRNA (guanine(527)-N(7))-methyltransferase RsmG [Firmicutes bacterium]|nr:16S rRNA (guanine(527)-N(7))-methyltransferase RsmG [Bacillota bacterium]